MFVYIESIDIGHEKYLLVVAKNKVDKVVIFLPISLGSESNQLCFFAFL